VKAIVLVPPGARPRQCARHGSRRALFIQDRSGKSIAVEPVDGSLKVHDASLGIMTSAPTYGWHMTNLQNYINLRSRMWRARSSGRSLSCLWLSGMPGDFTPPSRFVRAAIYRQSAAPHATAEDAVLSAFTS
jgi:choloylglycine hydrolase